MNPTFELVNELESNEIQIYIAGELRGAACQVTTCGCHALNTWLTSVNNLSAAVNTTTYGGSS
jgi:hypothetical protein